MDFLSLLGMAGGSGMGGKGAGGNPWEVAAPQQQMQYGQSPAPQQIGVATPGQGDPQLMAEFGTMNMPPSLGAALAANDQSQQLLQNTPQAEFGQFYQPDMQGGGGVLPMRGEIQPQSAPMGAPSGMSGLMDSVGPSQPMPGFQPMQGGAQPPQQQQGGGMGDLFNMTGSAPNTPGNEQAFDPNMFLRMSEGYNRGGLMGALGMLLTDYK